MHKAIFSALRRFQSRHRAAILFVFLCSSSALVMSAMMGCAGTWLSEAGTIIDAVLAGLTTLSGALTIFDPTLGAAVAAVLAVIKAASDEVTEIETLVAQYQTTPDETTLQKIESGIQLAITNLQPLLAPVNLPAALIVKIQQIAQVVLSQFESWASLISAVKPAPVAAASELEAHNLTPVATAHVSKPLSANDLRTKINNILKTPTGDAAVDKAFDKAGTI